MPDTVWNMEMNVSVASAFQGALGTMGEADYIQTAALQCKRRESKFVKRVMETQMRQQLKFSGECV